MATGARLARTSDVDDIAALQIRAWRHAYEGVLPKATLESLDADAFATQWAAAILDPPTTRHRLLVALDNANGIDRLVGYAALGPSTDPDSVQDASTGELLALVIDPGATRCGHGSRLMAAAVDYLKADGFRSATTWMFVGDDPRREFLATCGWAPDTAVRELEAGEATVREIRLATDLETS
ncbi:MAG: GNAT family N-acetyltransferase [Actinobacteria bacterium]|uniref:Unannotated protein n=1 Tax=freshwater metagenome TaxID=449393 RepID=A0A6J7EMY1_9ZZZZ|nr:GNAT family N-acetyltransferase [Actinomycetota bacterium]